MQYKINYEPNYYLECLSIIKAIINDISISNELEKIIKNHGMTVHPSVKSFFAKSISLESHIKKSLSFNFPGFKKDGTQIAEFLFMGKEHVIETLAHAIFAYERFLSYNKTDNKKLAILSHALENLFFDENWDMNPPIMDSDKAFFDILDAHINDTTDKFNLIKLYHNFDVYRDYTTKLIKRTTILYKEKLNEFTEEIKACMDFVEAQIKENKALFLKEKLRIKINDEWMYTLCPSVYRVNSCSMDGVTKWDCHIIFGIHFFDIVNLLIGREENNNELVQEFLKCIADNTKQSIIHLLGEKPMYGSLLAAKLGLSGATISHHMSALLKLHLVLIEKENNKIYYLLNKEQLRNLWDKAHKFLGL
jgi:DNA-binding transcriptional ArsR family regulator